MPHVQKNAKVSKKKPFSKKKGKGKPESSSTTSDIHSNVNIYYKPFTIPVSGDIPSILLIGEGDLSFSAELCDVLFKGNDSKDKDFKDQGPIHITSYDKSHKDLLTKYPKSYQSSISKLNKHIINANKNISIYHNVDATKLTSTSPIDRPLTGYNKVIFMFPHSGQQRVHVNRGLLSDFFDSVRSVLNVEKGVVYVTLTNGRPYVDWKIVECAEEHGFVKIR